MLTVAALKERCESVTTSCNVEVPHAADRGVDIIARFRTPLDQHAVRDLERAVANLGVAVTKASRYTAYMRLDDETLKEIAAELRGECRRGHAHEAKRSGTILVDYLDPNATKPLHLGHLRSVALGNALAALARSLGHNVETQQVVGDIGRASAEMLAGYRLYGPELRRSDPRADEVRILGRCYAQYVTRCTTGKQALHDPNEPIARELLLSADLADEVLQQIVSGDEQAVSAWRSTRDLILEQHRALLVTLGATPRSVLESANLAAAYSLIQAGLKGRVLKQTPQGTVYTSGREEFPTLALARPDGFPTEHMRGLAAWANVPRRFDRVLHVMGDEWVPATIARLDCSDSLGVPSFGNKYVIVGHRMVELGGGKMKSSGGPTVLLDELLGALASRARARTPSADPVRLSRFLVLYWFLGYPRHRVISLDVDQVTAHLEESDFARAEAVLEADVLPHRPDRPGDVLTRWVLTQGLLLDELAYKSLDEQDPLPLWRLVRHLVTAALRMPAASEAKRLALAVARQGCVRLGII